MKIIPTQNLTRAQWLELRRQGIGGSDVAAILGLSKWRTPLDVWQDKTATAPVEDREPSQAAHFGTVLEETVAQEFASRTGYRIKTAPGMLQTDDRPWECANVDRLIYNQGDTLPDLPPAALLECKTARTADGWGPSQEEEIVAGGDPEGHEIPVYYETQVQWYLGITGLPIAYVAVLIAGQDFRVYSVPRNDEVIATLRERMEEFWKVHVIGKVPPEAATPSDVRALYADDSGELEEATNDEAALIGELQTLRGRIAELESQEKALASKLIVAIGPRAGLTIAGKKAATYKTQTSRRLDSSRLKANEPELYQDYLAEKKTRVLRLAA